MATATIVVRRTASRLATTFSTAAFSHNMWGRKTRTFMSRKKGMAVRRYADRSQVSANIGTFNIKAGMASRSHKPASSKFWKIRRMGD